MKIAIITVKILATRRVFLVTRYFFRFSTFEDSFSVENRLLLDESSDFLVQSPVNVNNAINKIIER